MAEEQTTVQDVQSEPTEQPQTFLSTLSEDIQTEPSLQNIQDVNQLAKGFVSAQRMVGADKIAIPTKNSTPEDWQGVFTKLGLPESPDKYGVNYDLGEGMSSEPVNNFLATAHKVGMLPNQVQAILDYYTGLETSSAEKTKADIELAKVNSETELRKEFGLAYADKVNQANNVFKNFFAKDMAELKLEDGTPVGSHPGFIRALAELSKNFNEDDIKAGQETTGALTPNEAATEINKVLADTSHAYHLKDHPGHAAAVKQMEDLFAAKVSTG
jgi:hypothetical protein